MPKTSTHSFKPGHAKSPASAFDMCAIDSGLGGRLRRNHPAFDLFQLPALIRVTGPAGKPHREQVLLAAIGCDRDHSSHQEPIAREPTGIATEHHRSPGVSCVCRRKRPVGIQAGGLAGSVCAGSDGALGDRSACAAGTSDSGHHARRVSLLCGCGDLELSFDTRRLRNVCAIWL